MIPTKGVAKSYIHRRPCLTTSYFHFPLLSIPLSPGQIREEPSKILLGAQSKRLPAL